MLSRWRPPAELPPDAIIWRRKTHTGETPKPKVAIPGWEVITLYDGKVRLGFDRLGRATGFRHSYWLKVQKSARYPHGRKLIDGVTGVAGLLTQAASGLSPWATRMGVDYLRSECGIKITKDQENAAVKAHTSFRDAAAVTGTAVHKAVEDIIAGKPAPKKRTKSYDRGLEIVELLARENLTVIASEFKVYSREHEYAGTGDLDVRGEGGRAIIDVKTSKAFRLPHAFQIAAYAGGRTEELGCEYTDAGVICAHGKPRLHWLSETMRLPGPQALAACHNAFLGLLAVKSSIPDYRDFGRYSGR